MKTDSSKKTDTAVFLGNRIDYDHTKVLDTLYVLVRNGVDIKEQANLTSKSLGYYPYGKQVDIIERNGEWIGIRERITRDYMSGNKKMQINAWEKVYIQKKSSGKLSEVELVQEDLNVIVTYKAGDEILSQLMNI